MNSITVSRRDFLKYTSLIALSSTHLLAQNKPEQKLPNFIFILADDQGWNGTSVQMHKYRKDSKSDFYSTPNLERLAYEGMRFSYGYSPAALCCPTRRSIQFGQTPARQGDDKTFEKNYPRNNKKLTIPRLLKSISPKYKAAHFGKWDLRTDMKPEDLGYDECDGNTGNGTGNAASQFGKKGKWEKILETDDPKLVFTLTKRSNSFMEDQVNAGNPFYLQISHYATHVDMQTRAETHKKYQNKEKGEIHKRPAFAGMTEDLDTAIGKMLDKVEQLGIAANTYIIYMTDNGGVPWIPPDREKRLANPRKSFNDKSRNWPLRAGKWTLFEGGIRVPFIIKGPGVRAGLTSHVPVIGWDLLPTIADLAGYKKSMPLDLDGGSIKPVLKNNGRGQIKRPNDFFVFVRYNDSYPHAAILQDGYKYVKFGKSKKVLLFDLTDDVGEMIDISGERPELVVEMESKLMDYLKSVNSAALRYDSVPAES